MKNRYDQSTGTLFDRLGISPDDLFKWLTTASANHLADLLEGTSSSILCQPENAKMLGSVRGVLTPYIDILRHLKPSGPYWSARQWLRDESQTGWLFLTYRDDQLGLLRNFVSTLSDITMLEALSLSEDDDRRLWFILDELDSVGRLNQLKDALVKLRKFGGCCVLGIQTLAQLRLVYGKDMSQALIGNTATKVILRSGDAETAKAMEQEIGEQEIERVSISKSSSKSIGSMFKAGSSSANKSTSESVQTVRQSAIMASEIQMLPDLSGVLVRKSKPHVRFALSYVKMPLVASPFEK